MLTPHGPRPTLTDYQSAVARLDQCSQDPRLNRCSPKLGADGQPGADGGSFGAVYRLDDPEDGRSWALKCFLRDEPDRERRYRQIAMCLRWARGSWHAEVHYVEKGLWVHGRWWPVVLMEWVPGSRLTDWIELLLEQRPREASDELRRLAHRFASAVYQMHRSGISHGDLQNGNVLVSSETAVRFVDYDAMTVPGWSRPPRREDGHPDFRMPREGERGPNGATETLHTAAAIGTSGTVFTTSTSTGVPIMEPDALVAIHRDRFPAQVIHAALVMLSHDASLWADLHQPGADHLLLSRKDFRDAARSHNWHVLLHHRIREVRDTAAELRAILNCPVDLQPDLEPQPEVATQESVLEPMAWRPTSGPRPGRRPFLDLGPFTVPADQGNSRPSPAVSEAQAGVEDGAPLPEQSAERRPDPMPGTSDIASRTGDREEHPVPASKPPPLADIGNPPFAPQPHDQPHSLPTPATPAQLAGLSAAIIVFVALIVLAVALNR